MMAGTFSVLVSCLQCAAPSCVRTGNEVSLPYAKPFICLFAAFAGPDFIARAKFAKGASGHNGRRSAQRVIAAAGAGFAGRFSGQLFVAFKRGNARFQFFNAFGGLRQRFPYGCFIKDFQNV